jgi:hypothetical protein
VLSNLPPERNPGQAGSPVKEVMAPILGVQRGVTSLGLGDYINLRAQGVVGLRMDRTSGPIFQSGVTSSLVSGQKNINRRRMADFIQDSAADALAPLAKQPATQSWKDTVTGQVDSFLLELLSPNNPAAQRIDGYTVDDKSGNTASLSAKGIFVVIAKVRMTPTGDFIVLQTEVGESVVVTTT